MDEELNEHELEERFYSMIHHVDETQCKQDTGDATRLLENAPRCTLRRYWRTSEHVSAACTAEPPGPQPDAAKPKEEKPSSPVPPASPLPSLFQLPVPKDITKTIEIIEDDTGRVVELQSSDEEEVIEIAIPPKPTITIESSDDEELIKKDTPKKSIDNTNKRERDVSASPVPSVVSSVSDEFIRGDCIAFNISSRRPDQLSFDFSLHGSDLLDQTPSKKRKKKKSKDTVTSTPVRATSNVPAPEFATPKSKAKNKNQKTKQNSDVNKSIQSVDVYDSDSNQSLDMNKNRQAYTVTEKSLPSVDVYESDSNQSETVKETPNKIIICDVDSFDSSISLDQREPDAASSKINATGKSVNDAAKSAVDPKVRNEATITVVDLTAADNSDMFEVPPIEENIIMGNVSGWMEPEKYPTDIIFSSPKDTSSYGSTKVPPILFADLDFDNLKGNDKVCKRRRYSLTTLRAEMEKFYNESWGGENFNHREIQKSMSRDKSLWAIDPKDKMPNMTRRKVTCNYCNRPGHRDDTCYSKPPVCFMCGNLGHIEPRCPSKICVNCGSPNYMYSAVCRNCSTWYRITCAECGQNGHPASHCPDLWRRYHNTLDSNSPLEECHVTKKHWQMYCSGCTRRGHLVNTCRVSLPFSGLPINSPYVKIYRHIYPPCINKDNSQNQNNQSNKTNKANQENTISSATTAQMKNDRNKRQSKSPTVHENHYNKKRNLSESNIPSRNTKSPVNTGVQRKLSQSKEMSDETKKPAEQEKQTPNKHESTADSNKAPDFIPIPSSNRDDKGRVIQDNEVSDTSSAVTSSRIYVTDEMLDLLKTKEGEEWLKTTTEKCSVVVENTQNQSFLNIKGKIGDQEGFQSELKDWVKKQQSKHNGSDNLQINKNENSKISCLPKQKKDLLQKLDSSLRKLKENLGDPKAIFKDLVFFQNRQLVMLKNKVINPKQLKKNRSRIHDNMKKLNMILLGQAGLAGGYKHLKKLLNLRFKVQNGNREEVSCDLRQQIDHHYGCIFNAIPRGDYEDLVKSYGNSKSRFPNKEMKTQMSNNEVRPFAETNLIPSQQNDKNPSEDKATGGVILRKRTTDRKPNIKTTMNKLSFYRKRIMDTRPSDKALKKTRQELVRKLHVHIGSLLKNANMTSKAMKKMRKIQDQAQKFLNNV